MFNPGKLVTQVRAVLMVARTAASIAGLRNAVMASSKTMNNATMVMRPTMMNAPCCVDARSAVTVMFKRAKIAMTPIRTTWILAPTSAESLCVAMGIEHRGKVVMMATVRAVMVVTVTVVAKPAVMVRSMAMKPVMMAMKLIPMRVPVPVRLHVAATILFGRVAKNAMTVTMSILMPVCAAQRHAVEITSHVKI